MRIFITGGTGFIGRALCAALAGHDRLVLARVPPAQPLPEGCALLPGDLYEPGTWKDGLAAFRPDVGVHLAWSALPDYSLAVSRRNFEAGIDALQLLLECGCRRAVVSGTCFEYGTLTGCVAESQAPERQGLFAAFKTAQRLVASSLYAAAGATLVWTRPFFVYGAGQRPTSLIPSAYTALIAGRAPDIKNPLAVNDFIHVDDVADGLAKLATGGGPSGVYNLGTGQPQRVCDVVNRLAQALGMSAVFPPGDEPGSGSWADTSRMLRDYGWKAAISLEEGIRRTLAEWRLSS